MTILITGGAGFIGSQIILELLKLNKDLVVIDNLSTGSTQFLPENIKFYKSDINNKILIKKIIIEHNINTVIHLAAYTDVSESIDQPYKYYVNNLSKTIELFDVCIKNKIKNIIFSSTAACYAPNSSKKINENDSLLPQSAYGNSKLACEKILIDYSKKFNFNFIIFRYFNVAGADPKNKIGRIKPSSHLIYNICNALLSKKKIINIYGNNYNTKDGTCIRDFIHVADIANAHIKGLEYLEESRNSQIINLGYGTGFSVMETVLAAQDISNDKLSIKLCPKRTGDLEYVVANNDKALTILQWKPQYQNIKIIIKHQFEWLKKLNNLNK